MLEMKLLATEVMQEFHSRHLFLDIFMIISARGCTSSRGPERLSDRGGATLGGQFKISHWSSPTTRRPLRVIPGGGFPQRGPFRFSSQRAAIWWPSWRARFKAAFRTRLYRVWNRWFTLKIQIASNVRNLLDRYPIEINEHLQGSFKLS